MNVGAPDSASLDVAILSALYSGHRPAAWLAAAIALSFLGSGWMMLVLVPGLAMRRWRAVAIAAVATLTLTSGVVSLLKLLTSRVRPCNAIAWCHTLPIDVPLDHSFPSGHAAGSFAFATFVSLLERRATWFLLPLASLIALSRVALGVHYPTDVLGGALLGGALGWAGASVYRQRTASSE